MQHPLDWLTQWWNIALGRKVDEEKDAWLLGPIGAVGESAAQFAGRIAAENGLRVCESRAGAGLAEEAGVWGVPLAAGVEAFYRRTADFELEARTVWKPGFGSLEYLTSMLFSRRLAQLNLPQGGWGSGEILTSDILKLVDPNGTTAFTIWCRRFKDSHKVALYGLYGFCRVPSGDLCVKAIYPLPQGSATVIFRVGSDGCGNLELVSSGQASGDPGLYFIVKDGGGTLWKHYVPSFRECIRVAEEDGGRVTATHSMTIWSLRIGRIHYELRHAGAGQNGLPCGGFSQRD